MAEYLAEYSDEAKLMARENIRQVYLGAHASLLKQGKLIQLSISKFNQPN